jgi:hypothetical protein
VRLKNSDLASVTDSPVLIFLAREGNKVAQSVGPIIDVAKGQQKKAFVLADAANSRNVGFSETPRSP